MKTSQTPLRLTWLLLALLLAIRIVPAQTTNFTYQGKLADAGIPANGSYDFQFKLFDTPTVGTGTQQGSPVTVPNVTVTNGIFTVQIDFGLGVFPGADRFLEIAVKPVSSGTFTILGPRQPLTSTPYALKSLNAATADGLSVACMSCVTSSQIASVSGSAVTGPIPVSSVPAGSGSYIQNTVSQQAASNFNISGDGTAAGTLSGNIVSASTQYNIGGARLLSAPGSFNVFAGVGAGDSNSGGTSNAFFGALAGNQNTMPSDNSFFGAGTGGLNTTGQQNSFFGSHAAQSNQTGSNNSFFGTFAGDANTTSGNSFFGHSSGVNNTTGADNSFFGQRTGQRNTTANFNSFFGSLAGAANTDGTSNSFFGASAGAANTTGTSNSFFGSFAGVANTTGTNNSFVGHLAGEANTEGNSNSFFGFATGNENTFGGGNSFFGAVAGLNNTTGNFNSFFGTSAGISNVGGSSNSFFGQNSGFLNSEGTNNSFFGRFAGGNTTFGFQNSFFGSGAGSGNIVGRDNAFVGQAAGAANTVGNNNTVIGALADVGANNLDHATAIGAGAVVSTSKTIALGRSSGDDTVLVPGILVIGSLGAATATQLCIDVNGLVSSCSSSVRYKTNVLSLNSGLELIARLRPVTFDWRATRETDLGLIAEEVDKVEPLLVTRDKSGAIQGVKYDQLSVVLINAIKEQQLQIKLQQTRMEAQQTQIDNQLSQIERQQTQIEGLVKVVCLDHPGADICKKHW